jgi:hypothetical protein
MLLATPRCDLTRSLHVGIRGTCKQQVSRDLRGAAQVTSAVLWSCGALGKGTLRR